MARARTHPRGQNNVAIHNYGDPQIEYYIVILDETEPWLTVQNAFECDGLFDPDGNALQFVPGQRVLKGYLYSLRNRKERKYELHDAEYATSAAGSRFDRSRMWAGWPVVYFPPDYLLHVKFHMTPVVSNTQQRQKWYVLDKDDRDAMVEAAEKQ